jgi:hypothetical protein
MAKENEKKECCSGGCNCGASVKDGFNYGFGFWSAGLLVSTIVTLVAILIWYVTTLV